MDFDIDMVAGARHIICLISFDMPSMWKHPRWIRDRTLAKFRATTQLAVYPYLHISLSQEDINIVFIVEITYNMTLRPTPGAGYFN